LLNPAHPEFAPMKVEPPAIFHFDERLFERFVDGEIVSAPSAWPTYGQVLDDETGWQHLTRFAIHLKIIPSGVRIMQTMNISLPDPLKDFVDHQIADGRYSSVSEYIRELIRGDEKRRAEERLETLLLEGLESEESELTKQDFEDIRKEALAQLKRRKAKA
jgi:antitoxin ParD1/3/4